MSVTTANPAGPGKRRYTSALTDRLRRRGRHETDEQPAAGQAAGAPEPGSRPAPRHAATEAREAARLLPAPAPLVSPYDGQDAAAHPLPSFEARPHKPDAATRPIPLAVGARPYVSGDSPLDRGTPVWPGSRPAIGDDMPALTAPIALQWMEESEAAGREPTALPYTGPGWARLQMTRWVALGEWDDVHAIAEQGLGRNAAAMASGFRRNRAAIANGVLQQCAAIGRPDLAGPLLQRAGELVMAARAAEQAGAA